MSSDRGCGIEIGHLDHQAMATWDAFVDGCPEATFFHRAGWKPVIERGLGHRCYFLYATLAEDWRGVLPLVHVKSRIFGNALISTAFCVCGGTLARDAQARIALDEAAARLARELAVDYLEYRLCAAQHADWACNSELYATFRKHLLADPEACLMAVPRKRRAMIRKGQGLNLQSRLDRDVDRFYRIYAESVRDLGTPVFGKAYFQGLLDVFAEDCDILTVYHRDRPVSSVLSFYFRDEVLPYYGGGIARSRDLAANDFMYWELMRRALERGVSVFDFGRSKRGTGAFDYKKNWGFRPQPLYYEYLLLRRSSPPEVNPLNPRYRPLIALWRRLPLWAANLIGPPIARNLG